MTLFPYRAPHLVFSPFGSSPARSRPFWGQGRSELSSFCSHRVGWVGKGFESPILSSFSDSKAGELYLLKNSFWTYLFFGKFRFSRWFLVFYLEERFFFSFWVFSKYSFLSRHELLLRKEEAREVFSLRRPTSMLRPGFLNVNLFFF